MLRAGSSPLRRLNRLRELFARHGHLTRGEVMKLLKVSTLTSSRDLRVLCDEGLIEKVTPSGSPRTHYWRRAGASPGGDEPA